MNAIQTQMQHACAGEYMSTNHNICMRPCSSLSLPRSTALNNRRKPGKQRVQLTSLGCLPRAGPGTKTFSLGTCFSVIRAMIRQVIGHRFSLADKLRPLKHSVRVVAAKAWPTNTQCVQLAAARATAGFTSSRASLFSKNQQVNETPPDRLPQAWARNDVLNVLCAFVRVITN